MPFGKYMGLDLLDIPRSYLLWLRTQKWVGAWLIGEIDAVLNGAPDRAAEESFEDILKQCKRSEDA